MRKYGKVDANQAQIVKYIRNAGATVQSIASVGSGCPDIIVGYRGKNWLFEIKDGSRPPSQQKLTSDEELWHEICRGQVAVVNHAMQALEIIGAVKKQ